MATRVNILTPGHDKYLIYCDGELMTDCVLEAAEGENGNPGIVMYVIMTPNGMLLGPDGKPLKKVKRGKVEIREKRLVSF